MKQLLLGGRIPHLAWTTLVAVMLASCTLPRVPVRQVFEQRGSWTTPAGRVHLFATRDFAALDTSAPLLRYQYLPVMLYTVNDERDSVRYMLVGAWQEYLWRFSERLAQGDKEYYVPVPFGYIRGGDSLVVVWGYPSIDARDDDIRFITPYRNSYWSVEIFDSGSSPREVASGNYRSRPQFGTYDPRSRFKPGGSFDEALADSAAIMRVLRQELNRRDPAGVGDVSR